jgi:nitroreductase/dihydropteridine reductase
MKLIDVLNWRYATKRMNGQKIPKEKLDRILDATRLSASSFGLQPYTLFLVENEELRKKIQAVAYNQPQITEASHLLVFAAWNAVTDERVTDFMKDVARERGVPLESLNEYKTRILGSVQGKSAEAVISWTARQTFIALGTALIAAANEEVDATPMEGFNPDALDELLQLGDKGLRSVAILTLGYRDAEKDPLATSKKVRREKDKLLVTLA